MRWNDFLAKMKRYERNATVIFDEEEPIGSPTDLVLPHKSWFRRAKKSQLIERPAEVGGNKR